MGAACCGTKKSDKKYIKEPTIPPKNSEEEARLKATYQNNPALDSHGHAVDLATNPSQANHPSIPVAPANAFHESPEKLITEEDREVKGDHFTIPEHASQDTFIRFPTTKGKAGSQALDQTMKSQGRGMVNEGKDKNRSIGNGAGAQQNLSMGNLDQQGNENLYDINFDEKGAEPEDYYLELNEMQSKEYDKFLATSMHGKQKSVRSLNTLGGNKLHSQLLEWSKLLQKVCIQENPPNSPSENENKLLKAYEAILKLDERNWYEEMVLLYKEKNFMSKNTGNMTGLTFDRKIIQLQEQFKWLISAVANIKLNFNNLVGVYEFPTFRLPNRLRKSDKLDSSNASMLERQNSVVEGHLESEMFASPKHPLQQQNTNNNRRPSVMKTQMGSLFAFRGASFEPRNNFYQDLPEVVSAAWQEGFIWKGVFLKLYSLKDGEKLKREIKALKHLGVEYLQTEAASRVVETYGHSSTNNISEILETGKPVTTQIINILLPLVCTVESSTWILLGTPIFPIKKSVAEDQATRVVTESAVAFKNSFLLSGLTPKNFKMYYKTEEAQPGGSQQSYSNTASAGPHSSYLQGNTAVSHNNVFLLLTNVSKALVPLPKVHTMLIMNQEPNAHVTFLEFPKRKALDLHLIKQALGYSGKELDMSVLANPKKPRMEIRNEAKGLYLDMVSFRRRGWVIQLIYVDSKDPLPYSFSRNKRACDLLSHSRTKGKKEIKGNVLVFAAHANHNSIIHPYFVSEQFLQSGMEEGPGNWDPLDTPKVNRYAEKRETNSVRKPSNTQTKPPKNGEPESFVRDSFLKQSFKQGYSLRDEKALGEYFISNLSKSIDYVVEYLDKTDNIVNFAGIKELFHRKGLNMRFGWIVFMKLQRQRVKAMLGADILARCVKKAIQDKASTKLKRFAKQMRSQAFTQKDRIEELTNERNEFFMENFAKNLLAQYLNILIRNSSEVVQNPQAPKGTQPTRQEVDEEAFFDEMSTELFLNKMRVLEYAKKLMNAQDLDFFLSAEIIRTIMNISCLHAGVFLNAISYHMKVSINYEVLRQFRNDKYNAWVSKTGAQIKPVDFNFIYHPDTYLTIYERCYILLLKILPSFQSMNPQTTNELVLPASLYKLRRGSYQGDGNNTFGFDCFLRDSYELPDLEVLNDWIVLLESALNGLYTLDGQQNFLTEAYMLQLILAYFGEGDYDNQLTLSILERVSAFLLNSPVSSPELCITIYTWFGILLENKLIAECEQNYLRALLILHKLYGDPRGRGGLGTPWELFITWRLSILSRLQGKTHDAEYCEELFDATLITLKDNQLNAHTKSHYIYNDPLKAFYSSYTKGHPADELYHLSRTPELQKMEIKDHPFSYWTHHLAYTEANSKVDVINQTLQKTPQLLKWMVTHMPTFQHTGIIWNSANLRDFYLYILQSSFNNAMSMSSISSYSIDKSRDRSIVTGLNGSFTPKSRSKGEKKDKGFEQAGNLVQMVEKDTSTFNKKEINGIIYSWGQNNDGQVGTPAGIVEDSNVPTHKKMRIYYPKGLSSLKDTIIVSVSCGHTHSMAITITRHVLAWGSNKSLQLGLGDGAPNRVFVPTLIPSLKDVQSVSCGSEHTVALTTNGALYSWGQGEGGLLGHGNTDSLSTPKKIEGLKNMEITSVVCGGLHTIALTKQGVCYSWGRAEGGQLGLPFEELIHLSGNNELYLTTPKRIRGALDGLQVIQVACGDAHSLALSDKGQVYGWGYTNSGQLGLGITGDNFDPNAHSTLQVKEPVLIEKLSAMKIKEIFAGSTFSLFLNEKKELYGCGLNDYNQLGIEKSVTKINNNLDNYRHASFNRTTESPIPKLIDCFTCMPILNVACGENHSLALVFFDSYYMLFAWGMQRHGQLGIGDIQQPFSTPRPISFLQYVTSYSMACGAYHSLVVLGEASKGFRREALVDRLERKPQNKWSSISFSLESSYEAMIDQALLNLDSIIPSEEGKIDNPKAIKKAT